MTSVCQPLANGSAGTVAQAAVDAQKA